MKNTNNNNNNNILATPKKLIDKRVLMSPDEGSSGFSYESLLLLCRDIESNYAFIRFGWAPNVAYAPNGPTMDENIKSRHFYAFHIY